MSYHFPIYKDDVWDINFAHPFSCVDSENSSKTLLTTRIKGLIPKGTEVELELLGLQASVELLASVAELDDNQVPPICLEIAQLCGRLPLCLNIVGNLIRTFGQEWKEEVPSLLRSDMKSLTQGGGSNLQERIISSGLDAITGEDAPSIVMLFKVL